ncbi:MAG TPA: argininosuccinate lyase, partial [Caulobacter sp.]|nr:argininosuccinate lyase [Caulobacter sp.]
MRAALARLAKAVIKVDRQDLRRAALLSLGVTVASLIVPAAALAQAVNIDLGTGAGLTERVVQLIGLLTVMKGLPLSYSKDMQEDKEAVFDAAETLDLMLAAMTGMISDLTINEAAMKKAAGAGYSTATDLADWLV